jgi:hypothetical protein
MPVIRTIEHAYARIRAYTRVRMIGSRITYVHGLTYTYAVRCANIHTRTLLDKPHSGCQTQTSARYAAPPARTVRALTKDAHIGVRMCMLCMPQYAWFNRLRSDASAPYY